MKFINKHINNIKSNQSLRDIISLWFGQGISNIGVVVYSVALAWYVIELTGSSLQMGLVLMVSILPKIIFSMFSGVLGDRIDKKKTLVLLNFLRSFITLLWGFSLLFREVNMYEIYIFTAFFSTVDAFFYPIYSALIPEILRNKNLSRAASINQMILRVATIIAPALAGALIIFLPFSGFIIVNALGFLVAALFTRIINFNSKPSEIKEKNVLKDLKLGINYFYGNKIIFWSVILITLANVGVVSYNVNLPNFINNEMMFNPEVYGITLSFFSIGSFISLTSLSFFKVEKHRGLIYLLSMSLGGLLFLLLPFVSKSISIYVIFFFIGLFFAITSTISTTILFAASDEDYRGRVLGIASISSFLSPIGFLVWGAIGDLVTPSNAMAYAGIVIFFVSIIGFSTKLIKYN